MGLLFEMELINIPGTACQLGAMRTTHSQALGWSSMMTRPPLWPSGMISLLSCQLSPRTSRNHILCLGVVDGDDPPLLHLHLEGTVAHDEGLSNLLY